MEKLVVKFGGAVLDETVGYDIFKIFQDLFLPVERRNNMVPGGIQSEDLCKIRSNSGDKKTSGVDTENKLKQVYGGKYRINLDHQILTDNGVFYPHDLYNDLVFELTLAPASRVVRGSDESKLKYKLTNIQLEYEMVRSKMLADEAARIYTSSKEFIYIVLICPTFAYNRTLYRFGERDPRLYVIICEQHDVKICLKSASFAFEGTKALIVLDDCAASKDVKGRTGELVKLGFSARHTGISLWVLTQQLSSIAKPFHKNVVAIVLFYTPSAKTTKAIFEEYAGELSHDELKQMISRLKERKFACLIFSLRHPFSIEEK